MPTSTGIVFLYSRRSARRSLAAMLATSWRGRSRVDACVGVLRMSLRRPPFTDKLAARYFANPESQPTFPKLLCCYEDSFNELLPRSNAHKEKRMSATIHQLLGIPAMPSTAVGGRDILQHPPPRDRAAVHSMNAAFIVRTGETDVVQYGKLSRPTPAPGQVLVKVGAVAVNPIDIDVRSGALTMPLRFPYVVGSDFAGTVTMRGIGVRRFDEGDRVWGSNQGL